MEKEILRLLTSPDGYIGDARKIPQDEKRRGEALVWEYNQTRPDDMERRQALLKQILGTYNDEVFIQHGIHFDYGFNTHFLGMAFVNFNVSILDTSPVTIGARCYIAPGVTITCASHAIYARQRADGIELSQPVTIGSDVWIGAGAIICGGVTVGDRCVIGAGAVVLKDVPSDTVSVGVPSHVVRRITEADIIPPDKIKL